MNLDSWQVGLSQFWYSAILLILTVFLCSILFIYDSRRSTQAVPNHSLLKSLHAKSRSIPIRIPPADVSLPLSLGKISPTCDAHSYPTGFTWKHEFIAALDSVVEKAFREKGSTYSQIQLYEQELRGLTPPPSIEWPTESGKERAALLGGNANSARAMQRFVTKASLETGE